jgi:hypothetical protein
MSWAMRGCEMANEQSGTKSLVWMACEALDLAWRFLNPHAYLRSAAVHVPSGASNALSFAARAMSGRCVLVESRISKERMTK